MDEAAVRPPVRVVALPQLVAVLVEHPDEAVAVVLHQLVAAVAVDVDRVDVAAHVGASRRRRARSPSAAASSGCAARACRPETRSRHRRCPADRCGAAVPAPSAAPRACRSADRPWARAGCQLQVPPPARPRPEPPRPTPRPRRRSNPARQSRRAPSRARQAWRTTFPGPSRAPDALGHEAPCALAARLAAEWAGNHGPASFFKSQAQPDKNRMPTILSPHSAFHR